MTSPPGSDRSTGDGVVVRALRAEDRPAVLALNRRHEEELSPLDEAGLAALLEEAAASWVADADGAVVGFAIAFLPGARYDSANYRWFGERYDDFVYLDRIAVDARARRRGVAGRLYDALDALALERGAPVVCEVNLVPRNHPSLAFHAARGFVEVGQLTHPRGKVVCLLERRCTSDRGRPGVRPPI